MIDEVFAGGNSPIHGLDPRVRLVCAATYSFATALFHSFWALTASLAFSLLLAGLARLNPRELLRRLALVNGFILFFWAILPLTFGGESLFSLGPLEVSRGGVLLSAQITLKSNAILLAFIALVATSSLSTLGQAMGSLRVPDKMVHLLLLTYRYVFVIEQEYRRLARAARIRCFRPKTDMHTYRTYAYFVGMLFVRASARAERVHQAMVCRGFRGRFHCLREFSFTPSDLAWSLAMAAAVAGLGFLEWAAMG